MNQLTTKQFLAALFTTAFIGWAAGNYMFGTPGLSAEYLEKNKAEHEHYLEVVKRDDYKKYAQRPHLFDVTKMDDPHFAENIAFVEQYEQNHELHVEKERLEKRSIFFDSFNALLVVILLFRIGWRPLKKYLDSSVNSLVTRMDELRDTRQVADARIIEIQDKLQTLKQEEEKLVVESEAALIRDLDELRERHHIRMREVEQENEDQLNDALKAAQRRFRRELLDKALKDLEEELKQSQRQYARDNVVAAFTTALEKQRS